MASKRAILPFFSSRSIASTPRTGSRTPSLRAISSTTTARPRLQAISPARLQPAHPFQTRLLSSTTARSNAPPSSNTADHPPFKQWTFDDINTRLAHPSSTPTILIDVREPPELLSTGTIPTAICLPLRSQPDALFLSPDEFLTRYGFSKPGVVSHKEVPDGDYTVVRQQQQTVDAELVFYCHAGVRARAAAELAVQAGYDGAKVGVYDGSWLDWAKRKGKVERWEGGSED
ncbi:predicted protein [Uncinocarpus reesii 1704]|uniref:Rhodanese domain-containing protein n=1 Tax=Uncinocarpus reesii (strain UAMH 1704) TaxID=336963 RepID=C4JVF5_UNCRE|nr:uncharacterized protein UREG_06547 [Uncinocarpus reesii 1704]EEP81682.1 predicted protein [Uncinocarpus reesii 1704]